ncbi:MAG: HlyD family efflux transporter periplasmic adaptor subunit [Ginsengibacter sp.]
MKYNFRFFLFGTLSLWLLACGGKKSADEVAPVSETITPVKVSGLEYGPMKEYIFLNATSSYLQKNMVKSNLIGYVKKVNIKYGDHVNRGQVLFILKTKEADAIGNSVNELNPNFHFSGVNVIRAAVDGFVNELTHQAGDYVQDGEQLAVISDSKSFVFVLNVPYEYKQYISTGKKVEVILPDRESLAGIISGALPFVDSLSQTQAVSIKVNSSHAIPVNLVAQVKIIKYDKAAVAVLDKKAVLSDETQQEFWVMKLINDSTAVKVPVKTGIESGNKIEIVTPDFQPNDRFIISGNYGLADTAKVAVDK